MKTLIRTLFVVPILSFFLSSVCAAATTSPEFVAPPSLCGLTQVGTEISICSAATDPQGLPLVYTFNYGDSTIDALGKHTYQAAGVYPVIVTVSNGTTTIASTLTVTIVKSSNIWIKKLSIKEGVAGKQGWSAQYIYNADRTQANIFDAATGVFVASLGNIPLIQIPANIVDALKFTGVKPKYTFKSIKGAVPTITVLLDESNQTITLSTTSGTFADTVPAIFPNMLQLGASRFFLDAALDAKGKFTANSGYRSTAFVVSTASVKVVKPGKDSALFTLYLGDPAFLFPSASGVKDVRVRVTNGSNQVVIDKDLTAIISSNAGKLKSGKDGVTPGGKFSYDSKKGKMTFSLSKATLTGLLTTSEEHVRVDVIMGAQTYTTHVTLFAAKAGSYSTKLPKTFIAFIPGKTFDTTPPTITSTAPANLASGVPFESQISVMFSEAMAPASINAATFTLLQGSTVIPGTVTYSANSFNAVFTPSTNLPPNKVFAAMITPGVTDLAGNMLCCNFAWTFKTGSAPDTTPPTVISTTPINAANSVSINAKISATFSEAMDPTTLNATTFTLAQGATIVAGTVTYAANSTSAIFTPSGNLAPAVSFTATIKAGVADLAKNPLAKDYVWTFTTSAAADITPPTVSTTSPINLATGVSINGKVNAMFSESMDPSTMTAASFTLQQGATVIPGIVTYVSNSSTATFTPSSNLTSATTYTATIKAGVADLAGNLLAKDYVWTFTTSAAPDTTLPTVTSTNPLNLATGVGTNAKISATFSEPMDSKKIDITAFFVMQGVTPVTGTVSYATNSSTAIFTPAANLAPATLFTATIKSSVTDLAGNALAKDFSWSFTTGAVADVTPPKVISTNPADNELDVAINMKINATFDKNMEPSTLNTDNFTVTEPGATVSIPGTIIYDSNTRICTFAPLSNMSPSTKYTATLKTGISDLAGNFLAANVVWSFTTGAKQKLVAVDLGAATSFGTFGGGAGMTSQGLFTVVNGDISTTGESTSVTGFHDSVGDIYTETPLNSGKVNGRIYTAPPTPGGAGVGGNASTFAIAAKGAADAQAAYNKLTPASMPGGIDPGAGQLGGLTLPSGIYQSASGSFMLTGSDLTLDAKGDANAVWVFQMASSLTVGGPAAPRSVIMINGAQPKNVFWQVGSSATINAAGGGTMVGTIIASAGVTFSTADNVILVTLNGRALGLNASTTLVNTVINVPAP